MSKGIDNILSIAELIAARIFHDFASSISGIINSVEFLKSESMQTETLSLLQESSDDLMYKFKMMQQAYSFSESNVNFQETKSNIGNYLLKKKLQLNGMPKICLSKMLV